MIVAIRSVSPPAATKITWAKRLSNIAVSDVCCPLNGSTSWPMVAPILASITSPAAPSAQKMVPKKKPMIVPAAASRKKSITQSNVDRSRGKNWVWRMYATSPKVTMMLLRTVAGMTCVENIGTSRNANANRADDSPTSNSPPSHGATPESDSVMPVPMKSGGVAIAIGLSQIPEVHRAIAHFTNPGKPVNIASV